MTDTKRIAFNTRWHRKYHRWIGSLLLVFFLFIATTGILLGWKKNTNGYLLAETHKGKSADLRQWLSFDSLSVIAVKVLKDSVDASLSPVIDRMDARPDKGMIKILFKEHFKAIQLDGVTGEVLHIETRRADWIEKLHDGSLLDQYAGFSSQPFKLGYTALLGGGLLFLTISGFWLWINPRRIRKLKENNKTE
jgi:uncharacterized iron-regulated membrane protein